MTKQNYGSNYKERGLSGVGREAVIIDSGTRYAYDIQGADTLADVIDSYSETCNYGAAESCSAEEYLDGQLVDAKQFTVAGEINIDWAKPVLYDSMTGVPIRNATDEELQESIDAEDSDRGVITVDGRDCYVIE